MAANTPQKKMTRRVYIGVFTVVIIFTVYICINLFNISVLKSEYYRSKANGQQLDSFTINANRGTIYDSTGKILAQSSTVWDVIINPGSIREFDKDKTELICKKVAEICDVDYADLLNTCQTSNLRYIKVKTKVDKDVYDKITALRIDLSLIHI